MNTPSLAALAAEEINLADAATKIAERRDTIKAILLDHLEPGTHTVGNHTVTIRAGAGRIDAAKVAANHPYDAAPELYNTTPTLDLDKAKHHIAPAELDGYKTFTKPTVSVK